MLRQYAGISVGFIGFSFDNERTTSYSIGLGISALEDLSSIGVTSSISVTWQQWDKYASKNGGYTQFSVNENQNPQKVEINGISYFEKDLMYHDRKSLKMKPTGLKVYSQNINGKPDNQWKTKAYIDS